MALKKEYKNSLRELSQIVSDHDKEHDRLRNNKEFLEFEKFAKLKGYLPPGEYSYNLSSIRPSWLSAPNLYKTLINVEKHGYDKETFYTLNSYGLRSDEFKKKHSGTHILFAGCSVTFGEGLPLDKTWSKKLYDKISSYENTSGYFNVAVAGSTPIECIYQIQNYIDKFGKPNIIFFNIPDFERENKISLKERKLSDSDEEELTLKMIHGTYDIFRRYCLQNNIKLFSFSWDHPDATFWSYPFDLISGFDDFYQYDTDDRAKHIFQYGNDNQEERDSGLYHVAFDGEHPGSAPNDFYAKFMYDNYAVWRNSDK